MNFTTKFSRTFALVLCTVVAAACSDGAQIVAPVEGPQFANANANGNGKGNASSPAKGGTMVTWNLASAPPPATGELNASGGWIGILGHVGLHVPAGAVPGPAVTYTVSLVSLGDGYWVIDLSAFRGNRDIGSAGFKRPVELWVNPALLNGATGLAEYLPGGKLRPVPTTLGPGGWLIAELNHFSGYVPIVD